MVNTVRKVIPVRSKNAVNKSVKDKRGATDKRKSTNSINKEVDDDRLDEIFAKNLDMAIALLPTVAYKYVQHVRKWISKFFDPTVQKSKRNFYLAYLLMQMQNLKINDPFDKKPPITLLEGTKACNPSKWKMLMMDADKDYCERAKEQICVQEWGALKREFKAPCDFLNDQPLPVHGIICYGGCFSNHF